MAMADYDLSDLAAVVKGNGDGSGMFNNGEGLLWLLFILILGGGWGNRGYGGGGAGGVGGDALYPWMNLQEQFTQVLQSLCQGLAGVSSSIATGFANAETAAANRAMDAQQNLFNFQTAMMQGFSGQQMQLAGLGADIAREGCATRQVVNDGARDIMANDNANYQRIMDKLCQLELDGVKAQLAQAENDKAQLRDELSAARFQASQVAQNGLIMQGFANEVDALYNRLNTCPVGTVPVAGNQPIFQMRPVQQGCPCNGYN